jgi:excinuclease UvrABC ATPase subunit
MEIDPNLVLNPNLTIAEGGIRPYNRINQDSWWLKRLTAVGERHGFSVRQPIRELPDDAIQKKVLGNEKNIKGLINRIEKLGNKINRMTEEIESLRKENKALKKELKQVRGY